MYNKNLKVTWNHNSDCIYEAPVVNDEDFFSGGPPSSQLVGKAVDLVTETFDKKHGGSSISELAKKLADSPYDGKKLAQSAFVAGQTISDINDHIAKNIRAAISNSNFSTKSRAFESFQQKVLQTEKSPAIAAISIMIVYGVFIGVVIEDKEKDSTIDKMQELIDLLKKMRDEKG